MKNLNPKMSKLINTFDQNEKELLNDLLSENSDKFIRNAGVLGIALGEKLNEYEIQEIQKFYDIEDYSLLNVSDILIARIVLSLQEIYKERNIKQEFENHFTLDPIQPEIIFLINLIIEYRQNKNEIA